MIGGDGRYLLGKVLGPRSGGDNFGLSLRIDLSQYPYAVIVRINHIG